MNELIWGTLYRNHILQAEKDTNYGVLDGYVYLGESIQLMHCADNLEDLISDLKQFVDNKYD